MQIKVILLIFLTSLFISGCVTTGKGMLDNAVKGDNVATLYKRETSDNPDEGYSNGLNDTQNISIARRNLNLEGLHTNSHYKGDMGEKLNSDFRYLPNPKIPIHFFAHFGYDTYGNAVPMPQYDTYFNLYLTNHIAQPYELQA